MDAIKHLIEDGPEQENTDATHEWLRGYRAFLDETAPYVMTIGEIFNAGSALLRPYYPDQLHLYFDFEIAGQLLIAAQQGVGDGIAYLVGEALEAQPTAPWGTFLTNHDQNRAMTQLDGDVVAAKLAATGLLTLPGVPFIWAGEEIGMRGAKPDERIRTPMQWEPGPDGGFTTGTPWQPVQDGETPASVATQDGDPGSLLTHYRTLVALRLSHPALASGEYIEVETRSRAVLAFLRTTDNETVLVVINFGDEPSVDLTLEADAVPLAGGTLALTPLFGASAPATLVVDAAGALAAQAATFAVDARSAVIFRVE
jgi:glycosidase